MWITHSCAFASFTLGNVSLRNLTSLLVSCRFRLDMFCAHNKCNRRDYILSQKRKFAIFRRESTYSISQIKKNIQLSFHSAISLQSDQIKPAYYGSNSSTEFWNWFCLKYLNSVHHTPLLVSSLMGRKIFRSKLSAHFWISFGFLQSGQINYPVFHILDVNLLPFLVSTMYTLEQRLKYWKRFSNLGKALHLQLTNDAPKIQTLYRAVLKHCYPLLHNYHNLYINYEGFLS